ncbi:MAG: ABC transporter substrate-binding protein, partial [Conexibacter sp.]
MRRVVAARAKGLAALAAIVASVALAACGDDKSSSQTTAPAGKPVAKLTWALPAAVPSLDPAKALDTNSLSVAYLGLEGLMKYDERGALHPHLAASVDHPDATTYVFTLRPGVTFWDGKPLTAADVVWSLQRNLDPKTASQLGQYYGSVKSIAAEGSDRVVVTLKQPDVYFKYVPAFAAPIVEKAYALKQGAELGSAKGLTMGTGPFKFTKFGPNGLELVRNDAYWGPRPKVAAISLRVIADPATRQLAMRSGEVDGGFLTGDEAGNYGSVTQVALQEADPIDIVAMSLDTTTKPFDDVHVRRAMSLALDRAGIVQALYRGHAEASSSIVPRTLWAGIVSDAQIDELYSGLAGGDFDLDEAKAELAQSASPDGFKATIKVPNANPVLAKIGQAFAQNLATLGIALKVQEVPVAEWIQGLIDHKSNGPVGMLAFSPGYADPGAYPSMFLASAKAVPGAFNMANVKDPNVDKLLDEQQKSDDIAARTDDLSQVMQYADQQAPYIPVVWTNVVAAVSKKLQLADFGPWYYTQDWASDISAR